MESEEEYDGAVERRPNMDQDEDFDSSPRPAKRRKVTGTTTTRTKKPAATRKTAVTKNGKSKVVNDHPILDGEDAFDPPVPVTKAKRKSREKAQVSNDGSANDDSDATVSRSVTKGKRKSRKRVSIGSDEEDEESDQAKKSKHRIHIPATDVLSEAFLDDEPPQSSAPWSIRGPIWKKDVVMPKQLPPVQSAAKPSLLQNALNRSASRPDHANQLPPAAAKVLAPSASIRTNMTHPSPPKTFSDPPLSKPLVEQPAIWETEDLSDDIDPEDLMHLESGIPNPPRSAPPIRNPPPVVARAKSPPDVDDSSMYFDGIDAEDLVDFEYDSPQPKQHAPTISPTDQHSASAKFPRDILPQTALRKMSVAEEDFADELADLPSDAFESDPPSPAKAAGDPILITSSQPRATTTATRPNLVPPRAGLKQTTLFGGMAEPVSAASQANKRHAWPLATQREPPTHHVLNEDEIKTWVYPTNLGTIRDYQYNIVARGLYHNLLVALPTGLGKTFIAATIMLNWFRWTKDAQIIFVAPTKPLVSQQINACFNIVGIPRSETVLLTGDTAPALRAEEWKSKRVFFMTPQTIINDLKRGLCDPKRVVLVVVDEAHRATGGYAYVEVIKFLRRFNSSFRVLALTATPGSNVEAVQQVIDGLDISRCEIRTETSLDIRQYVHSRDIDSMKFDYSEEQQLIMELASNAIQPVLNKLASQNAYWNRDPMKLSAFACTQAQRQWFGSEAGKNAPQAIKGMVSSIFRVLSSLGHSISLLKFHGISPFYKGMVDFRNKVDGGELKSKYGTQIRDDENFTKMMNMMQTWTRNPEFLGHPKLDYLRGVVLNHFLDAGEGRPDQSEEASKTRVMIFAHWRDSAEEIVRVLKRNSPMIRPHVFVGQADSKGSEGMGQKRQLEVVKEFKEGKYNTLVATSIGEEGLDIGEVDLIVCYDASASPIRMLQRMGRTGRKRKGNIVLLLMRDKEVNDFEKAKDSYEKMQGMISSGDQFTFHDDRSPRIIPKEVQPVVDKRIVEIPVENSQADLPEPTRGRKKLPKLPPKKFNMPDNVRTGFVKASRIDEDDDGLEAAPARGKTKKATATTTRKKKDVNVEPECAVLPFLNDVYLNKVQERELQRKYQYVQDTEDGIPTVTAPRLDMFSDRFPGPVKYIKHGRASLAISSTVQRLKFIDNEALQDFKDNFDPSYLEADASDLMVDTVITETPDEDDVAELSVAKPAKSRKAPAKATTKATTTTVKNAAPKAKASKATTTTKAAQTPKPRGRPKKNAAAPRSSPNMEAASSSPEPTPANMRVATQGIDLGSSDTSGGEELENEDEEADSELEDFIAGDDAPIEFASSSMPNQVQKTSRGNRLDLFTSDDVREGSDDEVGVVDGVDAEMSDTEEIEAPVRRKVRRQVIDDDSDE